MHVKSRTFKDRRMLRRLLMTEIDDGITEWIHDREGWEDPLMEDFIL